jgi:trehalose-phosphatase
MKYLLDGSVGFESIKTASSIALFLDYDGTLSPIAPTPQSAYFSNETRQVLQKLAALPQFLLTIISGRSLEDIRRIIGIEGIIYVGNHGFEIKGPGIQHECPIADDFKVLIGELKEKIALGLKGFPGAFIEDKGVTISIHYRQVKEEQSLVLEDILYRTTEPYFHNSQIRINLGKKVFEIKPPVEWDKGKAVLWVLAQKKGFPVYIGDDTTDEDAFFAIRDLGLTIYVGDADKESYAQYYLKNTEEVLALLKNFSQ